MIRLLKWTAAILGGLVLAVLLVVLVILGWLRAEDPVAAARRALPDYALAEQIDVAIDRGGEHRVLSDVILTAPGEAPVRFTVSLPEMDPDEPMPVQIVVGGLESGRGNVQRLPSPLGNNAVIAFEYPRRDAILDKTRGTPNRILSIRDGALATPRQLAAIVRWAGEQPWGDPTRTSLLGYSLGALFVPATQEAVRANGMEAGATILAFGGADVSAIVPQALKFRSPVLRWMVGVLASAVLHPVEPRYFLPLMKTQTLLVNAEADELIPPASTRLMMDLTPEPKWVVTMPGDHINPRDPVVLARVIGTSQVWLVERGAANDPAPPAQ
jgi:hypothetical protein